MAGIVKGLHPQSVARTEKMFFTGIPDGEGEHANEMLQTCLAPALIGRQHHLGIAVAAKGITGKFLFQFEIIIDLAVENDGEPASGI